MLEEQKIFLLSESTFEGMVIIKNNPNPKIIFFILKSSLHKNLQVSCTNIR